jgi:hypothetical protein
VALKKLFDEVKDKKVKETGLALIETETDLKYRKNTPPSGKESKDAIWASTLLLSRFFFSSRKWACR